LHAGDIFFFLQGTRADSGILPPIGEKRAEGFKWRISPSKGNQQQPSYARIPEEPVYTPREVHDFALRG